MTSEIALRHFAQIIQNTPELKGVGVGYSGNGQSRIIKMPDQLMLEGLRTWVIVFEDQLPIRVQSTDIQYYTPQDLARQVDSALEAGAPQTPPTRLRAFAKEGITTLVSCGSATLTGVAAAGSAAAAPITGGGSLVVTYIAGAGALASAAQCGISIGRIINIMIDPKTNDEYLDSEGWYKLTTSALDGIALMGDVVGLGQGAMAVIRLSRSSGRPVSTLLRPLGRAERKRIAKDLGIAMSKNSNRLFKQLARSGKLPTIYSNKVIRPALIAQLQSAAAATLDFGGSTYDGLIRHLFIIND